MTRVTLIGIDPGIVDTGVVALRLDSTNKTWTIQYKVWHVVTYRDPSNQNAIRLNTHFQDGLRSFVEHEETLAPVFVGVEGYRQRGNNMRQDQDMLYMVQAIHKLVPGSQIIDNTGIKNVVTRDMLKLFGVARFNVATNHADLVSAARVALKLGISITPINEILYGFVVDNVEGTSWSLVST